MLEDEKAHIGAYSLAIILTLEGTRYSFLTGCFQITVSITSVRWPFAVAPWISWHGRTWKMEPCHPNMTKLECATGMSHLETGRTFTELETHPRWESSRETS